MKNERTTKNKIGVLIAEAILALKESLKQSHEQSSGTPKLDAELLLGEVLNRSRLYIIANPNDTVSDDDYLRFNSFIKRRVAGEPVAYITGKKDFWDFTVTVCPSVLIPRPETEILVEEALSTINLWQRKSNEPVNFLDLGTGSGCIAIALARELTKSSIPWRGVAIDNSPEALSIAKKNISNILVKNAPITLIQSDWCKALNPTQEKYSLIVANPPYVGIHEDVDKNLHFEPYQAIFSGETGTDAPYYLIESVRNYIKKSGYFLCEIGANNGEIIYQYAKKWWKEVDLIKDLAGLPRIIRMSNCLQ